MCWSRDLIFNQAKPAGRVEAAARAAVSEWALSTARRWRRVGWKCQSASKVSKY